MKYLRCESRLPVTFYPFVCWHLGAPQSDERFIEETVYRVKHDPSARWAYLGDGGECTTKLSKGDIWSQTRNIQEQFNGLVELLRPIRAKGLFGVTGNHDRRVFKETGMNFAETLMLTLALPYMGNAAFWHLLINKSLYSIYAHHGMDSGVSMASKINKAKKFEDMILADAIFSAHSHICCELPPKHTALLTDDSAYAAPIKWVTTYEYVCGCAYDSRTGYAEDKGYPPLLPAHLSVTFGGGRTEVRDGSHNIRGRPAKTQTCTIWRASA